MAEPVIIQLQVGGVADVEKAFKSIEDTILRSEKAINRNAQTGARSRVSTAKDEAREKEKLTKQLAKEQDKSVKSGLAAEKSAAKESIKLEQQKSREAERWIKTRERIQTNSALMAGRLAKQQADTEIREAKRASDARSRYAASIGRTASGGVSRVGGMAARFGGAALAIGGGFGIVDAVSREIRTSGTAADIANSGYIPGDPKNNMIRKSTDISSAARSVGIKYGMGQDDVLGGLNKFTAKTGRLDMGLESIEKLASLSRATGSSFEDMADAMGDVFNADTTQNADDVLAVMRHISGQGKLGAVEIKDLATEMAKLGAASGFFSGDKRTNVVEMGSLAQMARAHGGASSAEEAGTAVQNFASDMAKNANKIRKEYGVNVKDGKVLKSPEAITQEVLKKTGGDITAVANIFGKRSAKAVYGAAEIYRDNYTGKTKGDKESHASAAVAAEFTRMREVSLTQEQEKAAVAARMQENDAKIASAMARFQEVVATNLVPQLTRLIPIFTDLIPKFEKLVRVMNDAIEWLAKNPWRGVGAVVGTAIAAELAQAGIKSLLQAAFTTPVGQIAMTAAAVTLVGKLGIDQLFNKDVKGQTDAFANNTTANNLAGRLRSGNASSGDVASVDATRATLTKQLSDQKGSRTMKMAAETAVESILGPIGPIIGSLVHKAGADPAKLESQKIQNTVDSLKSLNDAAKSAAESMSAVADNAANRNQPMSAPQRAAQ